MPMPLHLYLVERPDRNYARREQYRSYVVAAETEDVARLTHPGGRAIWNPARKGWYVPYGGARCDTWPVRPEAARVTHLGVADEAINPGVILTDFKAG